MTWPSLIAERGKKTFVTNKKMLTRFTPVADHLNFFFFTNKEFFLFFGYFILKYFFLYVTKTGKLNIKNCKTKKVI